MPMTAIHAEHLSKTFRDFWRRPRVEAVRSLSFEVPTGGIFGLLGPNGSGKSTTLKMILGLLFPTAGTLTVLSQSPRSTAVKSRIGYLPEETFLYPHLTPLETLSFYARLFRLPTDVARTRIEQLLEMTGLAQVRHRVVGEFSKGMARRLGLAQALLNDPDLVILDEPTAGLDPQGTRQVKDLLLALAARGKTVLLTSHLLADVEDVCHQVAILFNGRL
ncbi:MAG: ABC transporter ATP-binding protein, partial [Kiritimatiellia bacterium]|nr:ABC transporter ATP-binding protein [Kiritimatiellia bacterium]